MNRVRSAPEIIACLNLESHPEVVENREALNAKLAMHIVYHCDLTSMFDLRKDIKQGMRKAHTRGPKRQMLAAGGTETPIAGDGASTPIPGVDISPPPSPRSPKAEVEDGDGGGGDGDGGGEAGDGGGNVGGNVSVGGVVVPCDRAAPFSVLRPAFLDFVRKNVLKVGTFFSCTSDGCSGVKSLSDNMDPEIQLLPPRLPGGRYIAITEEPEARSDSSQVSDCLVHAPICASAHASTSEQQ
jgi:hypothetical protein